MKKRLTLLIAIAIAFLLTACTPPGNVRVPITVACCNLPLQTPIVSVQDSDPFLDDIAFWLNTRESDDGDMYSYLTIRNDTDRPIYRFRIGARWRNPAREELAWPYTLFGFSATHPIMPGETSLPLIQSVSPMGRMGQYNPCAERAVFVYLSFSIYMGDGVIEFFRYNLLYPNWPVILNTQTLDVQTADDPEVLVTIDELDIVYIWNEVDEGEEPFGRLAVTNNSNYTIRVTTVRAVNQGRFARDEFHFPYAVAPGETVFGEHRRGDVPDQADDIEILWIHFIVIVGDYRDDDRDRSISYCFRLGHYWAGGIPIMPPGSS